MTTTDAPDEKQPLAAASDVRLVGTVRVLDAVGAPIDIGGPKPRLVLVQLALNPGRVVAAEALIRWQHPKRGLVPPGEFIPVAESCDLMVPLGQWVLHEACRQNRIWQDAGLPPIRVAVNISARQFQHDDFVPVLRNVLIPS